MAYITSERVAEIRKELKTRFPLFKFSVTRHNYSSVVIAIMEAPVALGNKGYQQVNTYYAERYFEGYALEVVQAILAIAKQGVKYHETGDYGTQPNFYVDLSIGQWNKPFKMILLNEKSQRVGAITLKAA